MLQVKQTTTTFASFRSPRLYSLPSTPGSPLNSGACVPISNSAEYAVAQRATKASTKKLRRSMSKLLVETKSVLAKSACKQAAKTYYRTETAGLVRSSLNENEQTTCRRIQAGFCGCSIAASRKFSL